MDGLVFLFIHVADWLRSPLVVVNVVNVINSNGFVRYFYISFHFQRSFLTRFPPLF